jgi:competence protein ComEC
MGLRDRVLDALTSTPGRTLEQGQALLMALLFGDRFWLDSGLYDRVARASLVHSLALSGLHLGFMAALGWGLAWLLGQLRSSIFLRLPRPKLAVLLAAPLVLLYLWLGQGTPSLWRAALMFAFWGLLLMRNRGRVLLDGLFLALAVILAVSPLSVFDLRLQLSALAVASIAVFLQIGAAGKIWDGIAIHGSGWPGQVLRFCLGVLAVSFCVGLALLPLEVSEFHRVTPWFALNLLWLPVLGFVILPLGFLGLLLTALPGVSAVGGLFLSAASFLLQGFADILAYLDGAGMLEVLVPLRPSWEAMVGYWVLLLAFALWVWRRKGGGWPVSGRALVLVGLFFLVWPSIEGGWRELRGGVRLVMLDVGQGQGLAVYWPGGSMLLDGGGSFSRTFDIGKAVTAPALAWNHPPALDIVAASHPDMDHGRGIIYPLAEFDVGAFVFNGDQPHRRDAAALGHALEKAGLTPTILRAGETVPVGDGIELEVLHPPSGFKGAGDNDRSLVFRLTWNGQGLALLPGDLEQKGIAALLASGADLSARVLVLPHHGSRTSVSPALYDRVRPDLALASTGFLNVFGYPHKEVAVALEERGIPLLTTAEHGAMTVFWDGPEARGEVEMFKP